jgi:para-aminobenzoate synthetase
MRTLLIDNYDSYTYNLYQLLAEVYGTEPVVVHNDDPAWASLDLDAFDGAVISPGPGHPGTERDFGRSRTALLRESLPVLGVCLGHQGIGLAYGAEVLGAPRPRHGWLTQVRHDGEGVFAGLPQGFTAVRYHSLCVEEPLPAELEAVAWSEDGVIMGIRHRRLPRWGVQFHPESICTEYGARLMENFRELALRSAGRGVPAGVRARSAGPVVENGAAESGAPESGVAKSGAAEAGAAGGGTAKALEVHSSRIGRLIDAEEAFSQLYGTSTRAFWLDSARVEPGLSRFSFFGDASGPTGEVLTFRVGDDSVTVEPSGRTPYSEPGTIFEALERRLGGTVHGAESLPFDLAGGYVGYFGYELKVTVGATNAHRADTPDAVWLRADRFIAIDHLEGQTYVVAVAEPAAADEARAWIERTSAALRGLPETAPDQDAPEVPDDLNVERWLVRSREQYLADIVECQRQLHAGESYEICVTNKLRMAAPEDDLEFYRRLRRLNPAPYSALIRIGELAIFSSSPERFMQVDDSRMVETKPIKGTAPRSADPELDETMRLSLSDDKTRAENLMIVDLLRNDLGRVCEIGSVVVSKLMATESYATVHQLVSTIRGKLRGGVSSLECVRACFPGGSMTGAPKLRTMEIIDSLESEARGVYSGALGYFGFTGTADLSIVIRTAVRWRDELTVGAGGAIVLDSDPLAEYDEMLLKAMAPLQALPPARADFPTMTGKNLG